MLELIVAPKKYEEIEFNFDQLKAEIADQMQHYTNMVVSEATIPVAKKDRASLNKLIKALDTKRKEVKKECLEPYEEFASKVKELTDLISEPINAIDFQLNVFEKKREEEKKALIQEAYERIVSDDIKEFLTFEKAFEPRWLNASVKMKDIETSLSFKAERVNVDLVIVMNVDDEFKIAVRDYYEQTLDIANTLNYIEALKRKREQMNIPKEVKETPTPIADIHAPIADIVEEYDYTFKFRSTRAIAMAIRDHLESHGVAYEMI